MLSTATTRERGDTLIEVLFAITVFAFIVVSSLSLMNRGVSTAQRSLEITTVRQQMDGQAETLRFLHGSYVDAYRSGIIPTTGPAGEYNKIIQYVTTAGRVAASSFGGTATCKVPDQPAQDFILNPITATMATGPSGTAAFNVASTSAKLVYSGTVLTSSEGIWIEAIRPSVASGATAGYIDFHIRACWDAPGANAPMTLGTIVRLYEPRG